MNEATGSAVLSAVKKEQYIKQCEMIFGELDSN